MRRAYSLLTILFGCSAAFAQPAPAIEWQRALGGTLNDDGFSLEQTSDGGYIVAGQCFSNNGNVTGQHGGIDFWVVKLGSDGSLQWQKALGGAGYDNARCIHQTSDQGYIVAGGTESNDGDVSGNHGSDDCWVVKLDPSGSIQWQRCFGGSNQDAAAAILQTLDDGYIIAGETRSNDGDVSGNHGFDDVWVLRLDAGGSLIWQRTYGGSSDEFAHAMVEAGDGGYVIAGASNSNDGQVTGNHGGGNDYWLLKVNGSGQLQWQKTCGGSGFDRAETVVRTSDGSFVAAGYCTSNDGDVTGAHGGVDCWVVCLDSSGTIQWQNSLGSSGNDSGESIIAATNGDLVVAGVAGINDGDVTATHGGGDAWVVRLSGTGTLRWEKSFGGTGGEDATDIVPTTDGGYAFTGSTSSNNGDVLGNHGGNDYWVVKLLPDQTSVGEVQAPPTFAIYPNPVSSELSITYPDTAHSLEVLNILGQPILQTSFTRNAPLDVSALAPGTYTLRLFDARAVPVAVGRFVKE